MIDKYEFGHITIDGKTYDYDVLIIDEKAHEWWRAESHSVEEKDLDKIIEAKPKMVIFGSGASGVMQVPDSIIRLLESKNIKVRVRRTSEAARLYNQLENKKAVVCAFHLTC